VTRSRFKLLLPTLLSLAGVGLLAGCFVFPTGDKVLDGREASKEVGDSRSKRPIRQDVATRADVLRVLGEPYFISNDGPRPRKIGYSWTASDGYLVAPLCFYADKRIGNRTLLLTFDENDVLRQFWLEKHNPDMLFNYAQFAAPPYGMKQNPKAVPLKSAWQLTGSPAAAGSSAPTPAQQSPATQASPQQKGADANRS
jgi:hypothetical protein